MKIALIDPSLFTWPYDNALMNALREQKHNAILYTKYLSAEEQSANVPYVRELFYAGFEKPFMKKLPHAIYLGLKGISHFFSMIGLCLELRHFRPDIIHFQWVPLPIIDKFFIPFLRKQAPVVLTVHDSAPFNNNPKSRLQSMGAIDIMKLFDHLIVHTEKAEETLRGYGIEGPKITRIAHGVLGDMFMDITPLSQQSSEEKPVTLLLFGQLKPYKGADILIQALAKMKPDVLARTCLKIAGRPQMDTGPLFEMAKDLKVDKNIVWDLRFIGDDEIGNLFSSSDITVMPYRQIDASGVLMLALSIGRPIVATRIGLFAELLQDGTHGYLVPMEDPAALAEALTKLINDKPLRLKMGEDVGKLSRSIPSWDDIAQTTGNVYKTTKSAGY